MNLASETSCSRIDAALGDAHAVAFDRAIAMRRQSAGATEEPGCQPSSGRNLGTIVVASSGLGHVARGVEAWANDLAEALESRRASVSLCKGGGQAERSFEKLVPCWQRESTRARRLVSLLPKWLGWRVGLGSSYGIEQSTFTWNLIGHLRRTRADILHVQDPLIALHVQRARRLRLVRTKVILAHGTEEPFAFQRKITYLQHLAPWHLEEARQAGHSKPTWTAIPNFIDTQRFAPGRSGALRAELGIPTQALVVLCAAAIKREHKRVDYLLREMAHLRACRPELPVWLVVAGGWETETDEVIAVGERLLGERVRFLVRFPRARMPDLYRAADVFTLCSLKEMMPIALIEAAASGLPCLVNRHPVMEWMIGPGGRAIDMSQPEALATALANVLQDLALREMLGQAARRHCLAGFAKDVVLDRIIRYYHFVTESKLR
jgi:1,2-diacylglycerol 3-alpha-glucosyltransferase